MGEVRGTRQYYGMEPIDILMYMLSFGFRKPPDDH